MIPRAYEDQPGEDRLHEESMKMAYEDMDQDPKAIRDRRKLKRMKMKQNAVPDSRAGVL
jgi:hypothetical protein